MSGIENAKLHAVRDERDLVLANDRVLPLFGDRKPIPVVKNGFLLDFSPDGRFLAYSSPESGRYEVYITTFPGGSSKWQVSTAGGASPQWRRDGKELYYLTSDNRIMAAEISLRYDGLVVGATKPLFQVSIPSGVDRPFQVSADGQRFLVNALGSQGTTTPINLVTNWNSELKK